MGETADLTDLQKTVTDSLLKADKTRKVQQGCPQSSFMDSSVEGSLNLNSSEGHGNAI